MPYSAGENRVFVRQIVQHIKPKRVLDVGAGSGTYATLLQEVLPEGATIDALEIWQPYIDQFALWEIYDNVHKADVRDWEDFDYDLVIFGDVMEHMSLPESKSVWARAADTARWGMISVPIIHYPQGAQYDNPHEVHVQDHLTTEKVTQHFGPFEYRGIYPITGTFFRRFR